MPVFIKLAFKHNKIYRFFKALTFSCEILHVIMQKAQYSENHRRPCVFVKTDLGNETF
jgi:hypothetical protein